MVHFSTMLSGSIPESIGSLAGLKTLILFNSSMSGSLPSSMARLTDVTILLLQNNQLRGDLNKLPQSQMIWLHTGNNKFSGSISRLPRSLLGALMFENRLSGTIPQAPADRRNGLGVDGNTSKMKYLTFSNNQLSGTLPNALCELSALMGISGNSNNFRGTFPKCLGALKYISVVAFTRNYLNGRLEFDHPSNGSDSKLATVIMSNNMFSCTEPALESAAGLAAGLFEGATDAAQHYGD